MYKAVSPLGRCVVLSFAKGHRPSMKCHPWGVPRKAKKGREREEQHVAQNKPSGSQHYSGSSVTLASQSALAEPDMASGSYTQPNGHGPHAETSTETQSDDTNNHRSNTCQAGYRLYVYYCRLCRRIMMGGWNGMGCDSFWIGNGCSIRLLYLGDFYVDGHCS